MPTRVFIVAEIRLYREGLERSLEALGFEMVGTAASADEALATFAERAPEVVLVDMAGIEATDVARAIAEHAPAMTMVALAVPDQEAHVLACAEAGVSSYVPREASLADLAAAIESAARGEAVCSPRITALLFRRVRVLSRVRPEPAEVPDLTARQWEVIDLIDEGLSNKEIARRLYIEVPTVKNHVHNILDKLQVRRRSEAAARVRGLREARQCSATRSARRSPARPRHARSRRRARPTTSRSRASRRAGSSSRGRRAVPRGAGIAKYEVRRNGAVRITTPVTRFVDNVTPGEDYTYGVTAIDDADERSEERTIEHSALDVRRPTAPVIERIDLTASGVRLDWSNVGTARYEVLRDDVPIANVEDHAYEDGSAPLGQSYRYRVEAIAENGARSASAPMLAERPPSKPEGVRASLLGGQLVAVSWRPAEGAVAYEVEREGATELVRTPFMIDRAAPPEQVVEYRVRARDAEGRWSEPTADDVRVGIPTATESPEPVTQLEVEEIELPRPGIHVQLTWKAASNQRSIWFLVVRNEQPIGWAPPPRLAGRPTFVDSQPEQGAENRYVVFAVDDAGALSGASEAASISVRDIAPPSRPTHLAARDVGGNSLMLIAHQATDNVGVVSYGIVRDGTEIARIHAPGGPAVRLEDAGLDEAKTYTYSLRAYDAEGNASADADPVEVTTRDVTRPTTPSTPGGRWSEEGVMVWWPESEDNVGVAGYRVFRDGVPIMRVGGTEANDDRVHTGAEYAYTVSAFDAAGNESPAGPPFRVRLEDTFPPTRPTGVAATAPSAHEAHVTWEAASDDVGVAFYDILRDDGAPIQSVPGDQLELHDFDVRPSLRYAYRVSARDAAGNVSALSDPAEVTMPADEVGAIGALLVYAFLPGQRRLAHVVSVDPRQVELQVVNADDGQAANGFVSVAAYRATRSRGGRVVTLEELLRRPGPDILGGAIGRLSPLEVTAIGRRLPGAAVLEVLPAVSEERLADFSGALDAAVLGSTVGRLSPSERERLFAGAPPPVAAGLLAYVPRAELAATLGGFDDERLGAVLGSASPVVLGDVVTVTDGDQLERVVRGAPAGKLGEAIARVQPAKATEALAILSRERLREVVLGAPSGPARRLTESAPADRLAGAVAGASVAERARLLDATAEAKLAEVLTVASERERDRILPGVGDERLGEAIVAAADTDALTSVLRADSLAGAILSAGPGVAAALPQDTLATVLAESGKGGRRALLTRLDDTTLAGAVVAAAPAAGRDIAAVIPLGRVEKIVAAAPADRREDVRERLVKD